MEVDMDFAPESTTEEFPGGIVAHDLQFFARAKAARTLLFEAKRRRVHVYVDVDSDRNPVAISFIGASEGAKGFGRRTARELHELAKRLARLDLRRGDEWPVKCCHIRLSRRDSELFAKMLLNPPEPTEALKRAFELHRELVEPSPPDEELKEMIKRQLAELEEGDEIASQA